MVVTITLKDGVGRGVGVSTGNKAARAGVPGRRISIFVLRYVLGAAGGRGREGPNGWRHCRVKTTWHSSALRAGTRASRCGGYRPLGLHCKGQTPGVGWRRGGRALPVHSRGGVLKWCLQSPGKGAESRTVVENNRKVHYESRSVRSSVWWLPCRAVRQSTKHRH